MNLLFTNAGRRSYLIEYAFDLKKQGYDIDIFVCDTSKNTAAMHVNPKIKWFLTPKVSDDENVYFEVLLEKCIENKIDTIIPLMDFELPVLAKNKKEFEKHEISVWVSSYETIMNCLDKKRNFKFCKKTQISIPDSWFEKVLPEQPIIKKQIKGSGSIGIEKIEKDQDYEFQVNREMIQCYIKGKEYGIDILNDYNGNYVHSCFREKILMRGGETDKAKSFFSEDLEKEAKRISDKFKHVGNMDVDLVITPEGKMFFIDFNPRFGGGYPFTHQSGANYIKFIIEESLGKKPTIPEFQKGITGMKGLKLFYY